jgi:hypothetical protein
MVVLRRSITSAASTTAKTSQRALGNGKVVSGMPEALCFESLVNRKWCTVPTGSPDVARAAGNCTLRGQG